jgi:predicted ferric reductase
MFALTFLLSTRITWIEDVFGGLDKVYITHGILGGSALILILFHPIFLVLNFVPSNMRQAMIYLLPSSYWSVNFGIIALLGLITLVYLTLFTKMKYNRWKFSHEFMGLMFAIAALHIFLVRGTASKDNIFNGYYVYAAAVTAIGLFGFAYSLFIKGRLLKNAVYRIEEINRSGDFYEVVMVPEHKPLQYKSGQFVYLRFYNERMSKEEHPFSIASKSNDFRLRIIIKKLGDFTEKLDHLTAGDKVSVEGPYGRFNYSYHGKKEQVWIAGGIGITPFLGMVQDIEDDKDLKSNVYLFYSVNDDSDFVGYNLLKEMESKSKKFRFIPWNSRKQGYLTIDRIYEHSGRFRGKEFFLCGPSRMKDGIIAGLLKQGVPENNIHEEAFDFR